MQEIPANSLLLQDHEETFLLSIAEAVFCILDDGRLSLSIATEPHELMGEAVFTFERYPIEDELTLGTVLSVHTCKANAPTLTMRARISTSAPTMTPKTLNSASTQARQRP